MDETTQTRLKRWLAAEDEGRDAEAQRALQALFVRLPEERPRPGFAGRVLALAGVPAADAPGARPAWGFLRHPLLQRSAIAACLLLAALALAFVPSVVFFLARWITLGGVVDAMASAFVALVDHLAALAAVGRFFEGLYRALLLVVTSPPVVLTWLLAFAVSVFGLRWLGSLLALERSPGYVEAR